MRGRFFFIVGPSGAGKDSLIDGARSRLSPDVFVFARRTITRPAGSPGEDHDACTEEQFIAREQRGDFLVTWQAHGLHYGLPASLGDDLDAGRHVIANGSRSMVAAMAERIPSLVVLEVAAPPGILQQRLAIRGRESESDVAERLTRTVEPYPAYVRLLCVVNDQTLGIGVSRFVAAILHELRHASGSRHALVQKIAGYPLHASQYQTLIRAMIDGEHEGADLEAFLIACTESLSDDEMVAIARCRTEILPRISWGQPMVVDKHSLGGIPGSRVTMVVIPIVAAHGLLIPKTSSRAITSAAGTADAMEVLARVDLTPEELQRCVRQTNACIAWNGKLNHSVLDDVMNALTRPLGLDTRRWSVASILSKKYSAGATHVVIDIPYSTAGKVKTREDAQELARLFEMVGEKLGMVVKAFATYGESPIGRGIGPALEARDVLQVLDNHPDAPQDLLEKSLFFASQILALDDKIANVTRGRVRAQELLSTGAAREALNRIVQAQGAHPPADFSRVQTHDVLAREPGVVKHIDGCVISGIARAAGAPHDAVAGVDLIASVGATVKVGTPLFRIQGTLATRLERAVALAQSNDGYRISD